MMKRSFLASLAIAATVALPAEAGDPFADPVTAEVLPGWELADGRRVAALRLTLDPGWKTYWRAPGDAGIPPVFDWARARNVASVAVTWPTPQVFYQSGMRSIGYTDEVVIPLTIAPKNPGKPVRLRGEMELGVCADVCMPHRLTFDATLSASGGTATPAIAAALASAPHSAAEANVQSAVCMLRPQADGMRIEAHVTLPPTGGREIAVIETGVPGLWVSEAETGRSGNTIVAVSDLVHMSGRPFSIDRSQVRITIMGGSYAVDVQGCDAG